MNETFKSERAPEPVGAFPHAKRVGELLFLSGIGPRVRGSKEIPGVTLDSAGNVLSYDIEKQCRAVFENVRLVLEDAGASWNDIVDVTVFLTNMKKDFTAYNKLYAEYFSGDGKPNPTRTTIEVGALPTPIAIELKVIAAVGYNTRFFFLSFRAKLRTERLGKPRDGREGRRLSEWEASESNLTLISIMIASMSKSTTKRRPFRILATDH